MEPFAKLTDMNPLHYRRVAGVGWVCVEGYTDDELNYRISRNRCLNEKLNPKRPFIWIVEQRLPGAITETSDAFLGSKREYAEEYMKNNADFDPDHDDWYWALLVTVQDKDFMGPRCLAFYDQQGKQLEKQP